MKEKQNKINGIIITQNENNKFEENKPKMKTTNSAKRENNELEMKTTKYDKREKENLQQRFGDQLE
jgi:hypothetical protein